MYTNDPPSSAPQKCSVQSYVDGDTKLAVSFRMKDTVNAFADLMGDLHRIGQWCSNNLLLLNLSKTKLMVFGSRQMHSRLVTPSLTFMGRELVPEHSAKPMTNTLLKLFPPDYVLSRSNKPHKACFWQTHPTNYFEYLSFQ